MPIPKSDPSAKQKEVLSRMHHKATTQKRLVKVDIPLEKKEKILIKKGSVIQTNGSAVGLIINRVGRQCLAIIRLDKVQSAMEKKIPILWRKTNSC